MTLGEKISILRRANNLSQENLSVMMNVSRQTVSKWERNESKPQMAKITVLARLFDIEPLIFLDDMISLTHDMKHSHSELSPIAPDTSPRTVPTMHSSESKETFKLKGKIIVILGATFLLLLVYFLMSTFFNMHISAYILYRMSGSIIIFLLVTVLLIELIKYFLHKNSK